MFGAQTAAMTSLAMSFSEEDAILHILLEQLGIVTECDLVTVDVDTSNDYDDVFRCDNQTAVGAATAESARRGARRRWLASGHLRE